VAEGRRPKSVVEEKRKVYMAAKDLTKFPAEQLTYEVEFSAALKAGESISSVQVQIGDAEKGTDASGELLLVGSPAIGGTVVTLTLKDGVGDTVYNVDVLATLSSGDVLAHRLVITCLDPAVTP
jgi:hypothetical protein